MLVWLVVLWASVAAASPACPAWPASFALKHRSTVPVLGYNATGIIHYDWARQRMLMTNDQCPILQHLFRAECDFLFLDGKVYLKTRLVCCHFGAWDGIGPTPPNLLSKLEYTGEDYFRGEPAYRYNVTTDLGLHNFWAARSASCNPLGFVGPLPFPFHPMGWSYFDPYGFAEGPQDPSLFEKPSVCLPCPAK